MEVLRYIFPTILLCRVCVFQCVVIFSVMTVIAEYASPDDDIVCDDDINGITLLMKARPMMVMMILFDIDVFCVPVVTCGSDEDDNVCGNVCWDMMIFPMMMTDDDIILTRPAVTLFYYYDDMTVMTGMWKLIGICSDDWRIVILLGCYYFYTFLLLMMTNYPLPMMILLLVFIIEGRRGIIIWYYGIIDVTGGNSIDAIIDDWYSVLLFLLGDIIWWYSIMPLGIIDDWWWWWCV